MLAKASDCKACRNIGENFKPVSPHSKGTPQPNFAEPNEEIQMDVGGTIFNEKWIKQIFLALMDILKNLQ